MFPPELREKLILHGLVLLPDSDSATLMVAVI